MRKHYLIGAKEYSEMMLTRMIWKALCVLIVLSQLMMLSGCRNEDGEEALRNAVEISRLGVESLQLRPENGGAILEAGTQVQFQAFGIKADSSELDVTDRVIWGSSNSDVFTVDATGRVSAQSLDGSASLTATWGGLSTSLSVDVSTAALLSLAFDAFPSSISECFSGTQLSVLGTYADRTSDITHLVNLWQSSDTTLASISGSGLVSTLDSGTVQFTAEYGGESVSQSTTIDDDLDSLAIEPSTAFSIEEGATFEFTATGTDTSGGRDVSSIATFSGQTAGILSFSGAVASTVAQGSTQVSAECGGLTSNLVSVTVTEPKQLSSLEIRYSGSANDPVGPLELSDGPIQLRAFLIYSDSTELEVTDNDDLSWSVTATISGTAASIDNDGSDKGEVDFSSIGRTEITAVYDTDDDYLEDTIDILVE